MYERQLAQTYLAGEIACTLSHLKAIRLAYAKGYKMVLVLEDDVSLKYVDRWKVPLSKLMEEAPFGWQVSLTPTISTLKRPTPLRGIRNLPLLPFFGRPGDAICEHQPGCGQIWMQLACHLYSVEGPLLEFSRLHCHPAVGWGSCSTCTPPTPLVFLPHLPPLQLHHPS